MTSTVLRGRVLNGKAWLVSASSLPPPPPPAPILTLLSVTGQAPGGTSLASLSFANGKPASIIATVSGAALSISGVTITTAAGAGGAEAGTASFTFTTPAAGVYTIAAQSTGTYAATSNTFQLTTATPSNPATLAINGIVGTAVGGTSVATLSFTNGAPVSLTVTLDGVPLAVSGITITTATGSGSSAAGSASFSFPTPAQGTHTVVATGTGTFNAVSNIWTLISVPPPVVIPPGTPPPKLSGIRITQAYPIGADTFGLVYVAYCDPIGGIGPFIYGISSDPSHNYRMQNGTGDTIILPETVAGPNPDPLTMICVDKRGDTATASFMVAKAPAGSSGVILNTRNPVNANMPFFGGVNRPQDAPLFTPTAFGAAHVDIRGETLSVTKADGTVSPQWTVGSQGSIQSKTGVPPVPGSYPVILSRTNAAKTDTQRLTTSLVVVDIPQIGYIELVPKVSTVSTATLVGTVLGTLAATTPSNSPAFSINDPSATVSLDASSGNITLAKVPSVGTFQFNATVTDGHATFTQTISVPIVAGTILSSSNMSLTVNSSLDNSRINQSVGTPTVTGVTGTKTWSIPAQTGFNFCAATTTPSGDFGSPRGFEQPLPRYVINPTTGAIVTAPTATTSIGLISSAAMLSYQRTDYNYIPDTITVSCTDGVNTCTRTFSVPVAEAPTTYYHVERGNNAPYNGIAGADLTRTQAMQLATVAHPGVKIHLLIYAHPEAPEFYTDWTRPYRAFIGPGAITFVSVNGIMPRIGGSSTNSVVNSGISSAGGKGHLVFGDGDWEVFGPGEISGVQNQSGSNTGPEGIRKDGNTWGNLRVSKVRIINNGQGIETGVCHGYVTVDDCDICQCGGSQVSAGLTHGLYIGSVSRVTVRNTVVRRTLYGHAVKSRAVETIITGTRIWDSSSGSTANCINLPYMGKVTITNNHLVKSVFASNPYAISAGEDGPGYVDNDVTISNNVMDIHAIPSSGSGAAGSGTIIAANHWFMRGATGVQSTFTLTNNSAFLAPQTTMTSGDNHWIGGGSTPAPVGATVETGTTILAVPPAFDLSDPVTGGTLPSPWDYPRPFRHRNLGGDNAIWGQNWLNQLQMHREEEFRVSRNAPIGTPICTIRAMGDQIDNASDPFAVGQTVYTVLTVAAASASNPNAYDTTGWAVTSNADGTGVLKTAATGLTPGVHFVQVRAVSGDGTHTSDSRYPVIVT